jgi:hypothetical protein
MKQQFGTDISLTLFGSSYFYLFIAEALVLIAFLNSKYLTLNG